MATTNLLSYRSKKIFPDRRIIMAICKATRKICFLTTIHGHLPSYTEDLFSCHNSWPFAELQGRFVFLPQFMAVCQATRKISFLTTVHGHLPPPSHKTFFPDDAGFSYLLSRLAGQNTCSFAESHTLRIYILR